MSGMNMSVSLGIWMGVGIYIEYLESNISYYGKHTEGQNTIVFMGRMRLYLSY